jgi:SAM-dependent methyltransferase
MSAPKNWFETWFSQSYYDMLYQHRDEDEAAAFITGLINYLHPQPNATILDAACGKGRHATYLASKGFDVTGIDLSFSAIKEAKSQENEHLSFFRHDMRNKFRINYFDFIFNFYTSFGYFESIHEDEKCIRAFADGLKPGGKLIIDFLNVIPTLQNLVEDEYKVIGNVHFKITKSYVDGMITKKIVVTDNGKQYTFFERVRALQLSSFEKYFNQAGLKIINTIGNYKLQPYNKINSERLIIIAEK